jgi:transcriptional regulator of acetoin/glycerol metabolism
LVKRYHDLLEIARLVTKGPEILIPEKPLSLRELEKRYVLKVLQETGGNKKKASEILGIDRTTLYKILEKEDV